jgi:hypothetical protein
MAVIDSLYVAFGVDKKKLESGLMSVDGLVKKSVNTLKGYLAPLAGVAEGMDRAQFAGMAKKLGLDHGTIMLLQQGKKATEELVAAGKGLAYTKEDAEVAAAYNDAMQDLGKSFKSVAAILLQVAVPAVTFIAEKLGSFFKFLREHGPFIKILFGMIAGVITAVLVPAFVSLAAAILANPLTWLIGAAVALALVLDDLWVYLNGGESAFAGLWAEIGLGEHTLKQIEGVFSDLKAAGTMVWESLKDAAAKYIEYFGGTVQPALDLLKAILIGIGAVL